MTATTAFQYKTSAEGTAIDVPVEAWPRDDGVLFLEYPKLPELDGVAAPCGGLGKPRIVFRSPEMTGDGMTFWQGLFSTATTESVTIWLKVFNPRGTTNTWEWWTGTMHRPKFSDPSPGAGPSDTIFRNVEILVYECAAVV